MAQTFSIMIRDDSADYQVVGTVEPGDPRTWHLHGLDPAHDPLAIGGLRIFSLGEWDALGDEGLDLAPLLKTVIHDRISETTRARLEALARSGALT